jgi:3-oxoacyl-[acyl-carrier-protein] synthase-3
VHARIIGVEYHLPDNIVSTEALSRRFPEWRVENIDAKTGIEHRHVAAEGECASDLAVLAGRKLFDSGICSPGQVDFLLLCTQSPDYVLPSTACLLQERLGISSSVGALDFNLGCSGFVYGLGLAEGLISTGQARCVLLITADTYSKYISPDDKSCLTVFGDAAAATLLVAQPGRTPSIGPFVYGTDGRGANQLIVPGSGTRRNLLGSSLGPLETSGKPGRPVDEGRLYMNGNSVFQFAISQVPTAVNALLDKAGLAIADIDLFVFHQANAYLLEELRTILGIPRDKFQIAIRFCANTVSSSIPIALHEAHVDGRLSHGTVIMIVGFGVGFSWGATLVRWSIPG